MEGIHRVRRPTGFVWVSEPVVTAAVLGEGTTDHREVGEVRILADIVPGEHTPGQFADSAVAVGNPAAGMGSPADCNPVALPVLNRSALPKNIRLHLHCSVRKQSRLHSSPTTRDLRSRSN